MAISSIGFGGWMVRRLLSLGPVFTLLLLCFLPLASQQNGGLGGRRFGVSGTLRDSETNATPENVMVELRLFSGQTVGQVYTNQNGSFDFGRVAASTYDLIANIPGYEPIDQQLTVDTNMAGIQLELHRKKPDPDTSGPLVSVRELSIPRKAHDDMEKGLTLLYQKSDYQGSLALFQKAAREYPDYYEAYAEMGTAYMKMGDAADSEQMLRKSLAISNDAYADAFCMLASLFTSNQRFAEAEAMARKAVELNANGWQGHYELARALYAQNNFTGARASAAEAVELQPDNAETYLVLANIHNRLHDYPKLVVDLDTYLKLAPTGPDADQARQTRDQVRQSMARLPGNDVPPAPKTTP
jgi:Tfp pilus assembly protein PilF